MIEMRITNGGVNGACSAVHQYLNRNIGDLTGFRTACEATEPSPIIPGGTATVPPTSGIFSKHGNEICRLAPCFSDDDDRPNGSPEQRGRPLDQLRLPAPGLESAEVEAGHAPVSTGDRLMGRLRLPDGVRLGMASDANPTAGAVTLTYQRTASEWGHRRACLDELVKMAGSESPCSELRTRYGAGGLADARYVSMAGRSSVHGSECVALWFKARVLYVGGYANSNADNAPKYGLSYANANNDLTNADSNIGGRLTCFHPLQNTRAGPTSHEVEQTVDCFVSSSTVLRNEGIWNEGKGMPRTIKKLKRQIISLENIREAVKVCCSKRKDKAEVARYLADADENVKNIQRMLVEGTYRVSDYRYIQRYEHGKLREIGDLPLCPDRIIHQAFAQVIEPLLDGKLIPQTHASRPGHGIHSALVQARKCIDKNPKVKLCLSVDAHHCYKSILPSKLKSVLRRCISDEWTYRWLCYFIDAYPEPGICIGDRLSPLFCNLYFNEIDHYMYEVKRCHGYIAYADNRFIFGNSRVWLLMMKAELEKKFAEYGLEINPNWHIADLTKEGVDFLGFRLYKTHTILRKSTKKSLIRAMMRLRKKLESGLSLDEHDLGTLNSYLGLMRWCKSKNLYNTYCKPVVELHQRDSAKKKALKGGNRSCDEKKKVNS